MLEAGCEAYDEWEGDPAKSMCEARVVNLAIGLYTAMRRVTSLSQKAQVGE